jgi:dephospho-CoA kinase
MHTTGIKIAITGGIGVGKSFVLRCFARLGAKIFNADKAVHMLFSREGEAYEAIANIFPTCVTEQGVDRRKLGAEVFSNPQKLKQLEEIVHPLVAKKEAEFVQTCNRHCDKLMVFEIPLLYEIGTEKQYDFVVLANAPKFIQKQRVLARRTVNEKQLEAIEGRRLPLWQKMKKADFVINTGLSKAETIKQIKRIVQHVTAKRSGAGHRDDRSKDSRRSSSNRDWLC